VFSATRPATLAVTAFEQDEWGLSSGLGLVVSIGPLFGDIPGPE